MPIDTDSLGERIAEHVAHIEAAMHLTCASSTRPTAGTAKPSRTGRQGGGPCGSGSAAPDLVTWHAAEREIVESCLSDVECPRHFVVERRRELGSSRDRNSGCQPIIHVPSLPVSLTRSKRQFVRVKTPVFLHVSTVTSRQTTSMMVFCLSVACSNVTCSTRTALALQLMKLHRANRASPTVAPRGSRCFSNATLSYVFMPRDCRLPPGRWGRVCARCVRKPAQPRHRAV